MTHSKKWTKKKIDSFFIKYLQANTQLGIVSFEKLVCDVAKYEISECPS